MECPECKGKFVEKVVPRVFVDKYLEPETHILECNKCWLQLLDEAEVERIYQKIRRREKQPTYKKALSDLFSRISLSFKVFSRGIGLL